MQQVATLSITICINCKNRTKIMIFLLTELMLSVKKRNQLCF